MAHIGVSDLFPKMSYLRGFVGEAWYSFSIIVPTIPPLRLSVAFALEYIDIVEKSTRICELQKELSRVDHALK